MILFHHAFNFGVSDLGHIRLDFSGPYDVGYAGYYCNTGYYYNINDVTLGYVFMFFAVVAKDVFCSFRCIKIQSKLQRMGLLSGRIMKF